MKLKRIEISFPVSIEPPNGFFLALDGLVDMICKKYEAENPDRVMWAAGSGSKMLSNPYLAGDDAPLRFDESVYHLECAEREDYHGTNPHNPKAEQLQRERAERRNKQ